MAMLYHIGTPVFAIALVLLLGVPTASAEFEGFKDRFDIGWTIKIAFQDVGEGIASLVGDEERLNELRIEHIEDAQREVDIREQEQKPIPIAIVQRIDQKITQLDDTDTIGDTIIKTIRKANEINEIRILYSEFQEVKQGSFMDRVKFNDRVNNLQSWKDNCRGTFDIANFDNDKTSFDILADQHCPALKTKTITQLKTMLYG